MERREKGKILRGEGQIIVLNPPKQSKIPSHYIIAIASIVSALIIAKRI